jgi:putative drug exporter of the RND superfamily
MLARPSIVLGGSVSDKLGTGGNTDPASESSQADEFLDQHVLIPAAA